MLALGKARQNFVQKDKDSGCKKSLQQKRICDMSSYDRNIGDKSSYNRRNHDKKRVEQFKRTVQMIVGNELIRINHVFGNKA